MVCSGKKPHSPQISGRQTEIGHYFLNIGFNQFIDICSKELEADGRKIEKLENSIFFLAF